MAEGPVAGKKLVPAYMAAGSFVQEGRGGAVVTGDPVISCGGLGETIERGLIG
ncbi:MAG TPA: hypothetical protein VFJ10_12635 [Acidobacteriaceae bacterium]|jgi:hypothetical protein|nr:hypothetical protein [Acidobacteriaceae bacterium]